MRCWNCNREMPATATACAHCESPVMPEPSAEEFEVVSEMLQKMPPDLLAEFCEILKGSATAEEFADRILVGECPKCGSQKTGNCENDSDINHLLVGRCYECGQLFCAECLKLLKVEAPTCKCWEEE